MKNTTLLKVKDLKKNYPGIYKAYMDEQKRIGNNPDDTIRVQTPMHLGGINWSESPQRYEFWNAIAKQEFDKAKAILPDPFLDSEELKKYKELLSDLLERKDSVKYHTETAKQLLIGNKLQNADINTKSRKLAVMMLDSADVSRREIVVIESELSKL